ncbi:hypothetical protein DM01DRAFT_1387067 [Hesseltinella vesiculosa]|uniref:Uncharacterized protein n=1 Tax=Hesseltinella vesiculosa TaxID=101127 RepID=A0A1X2G3F5_9FUNG|nr:hypothetical protein DM01DRAFT_1387067 [Hesseltinella vesiculosa]
MNYFPSPPSSPTPSTEEKVMCGACDKPLGDDWYCSDCHRKCEYCNRFLTNEPCSRCWMYDTYHQTYVRKPTTTMRPNHYPFHVTPTYNPSAYYVAPPSPPLSMANSYYDDASFYFYSQMQH